MNPIFFHTTQWDNLPVTEHRGTSGVATWRTLQFDTFRVRMVEYSQGYEADHWCRAGHVLFCLEGEMESQLADGRSFRLVKGMSYQVSDNVSLHRTVSKTGVKLLIVDGNFLSHKPQHSAWRM